MLHISLMIGIGYGLVKLVQNTQEDREYRERREYNNRLAYQQSLYQAQIFQQQIEKRKNEISLAFTEVKTRKNYIDNEINKLFQLQTLHPQNSLIYQTINVKIALAQLKQKQEIRNMNLFEIELNKIGYTFNLN